MIDRTVYAASVLAELPGPAGEYAYSNAGYVVVGTILEVSTGQPWEALIRQQVFDPLGMASAGFGPPGSAGLIDQPRGHTAGLLRPLHPVVPDKDADNIPALGPAGTVHLSLADMMRFLRAHAVRDPAFLTLHSWTLLQTPLPGQDYALGWGFMPDGALRHAGSNTMWYALMIVQQDTGKAAFAAVNYADLDQLQAVLPPLLQAELAH